MLHMSPGRHHMKAGPCHNEVCVCGTHRKLGQVVDVVVAH